MWESVQTASFISKYDSSLVQQCRSKHMNFEVHLMQRRLCCSKRQVKFQKIWRAHTNLSKIKRLSETARNLMGRRVLCSWVWASATQLDPKLSFIMSAATISHQLNRKRILLIMGEARCMELQKSSNWATIQMWAMTVSTQLMSPTSRRRLSPRLTT